MVPGAMSAAGEGMRNVIHARKRFNAWLNDDDDMINEYEGVGE